MTFYDVTASFLVEAEDEQKARAKVYNFVTGQSSGVDDWDVTTVEENRQWEVSTTGNEDEQSRLRAS